ncbi:MAG: hypothetical protein LBP78_04835 [Acidaminococcales bacterium]|jgi:hypothetical protein|nr:hypothetical protein [Acidaminococcales bacterium]
MKIVPRGANLTCSIPPRQDKGSLLSGKHSLPFRERAWTAGILLIPQPADAKGRLNLVQVRRGSAFLPKKMPFNQAISNLNFTKKVVKALTILDLIKAAENTAQEKKLLASAMARDYLRAAESEASRAADKIVAQARAAAREKVAAAEKEASAKLRGLLAERDAHNRLLIERASERVSGAADYIVGEVAG